MKILLLTGLLASVTFAATLAEQAKQNGLVPLPNSEKELMKLVDNPKNPITKEKISLGMKLFFDPRLSKSGLISCNTCHNLATGGVDGLAAAVGHKWTVNPHHLNSPTVYNAVFASSQFWDGRDPDLEKQAQGPIQAGPEMAATKKHVVNTVTSIPSYVAEFKAAYGKKVKISFEKITDTIASFERILVTPSRYDAFLLGKKEALTKEEQKGMSLFIQKGCTSCHSGVALGGTMQMLGVVAKYKYANIGDFKGDKNGMVKVPTLRNIARTAPYFHNGAVATLKEAIIEMGRIQLGTKISNSEAKSIETFLGSLDALQTAFRLPVLPASTNKTPKSDIN